MAAEKLVADVGGLFPSSERVIYRNAPLVEVVAQLRFPPILRIEGSVPAEFQERIRTRFPLLEKGTPVFGASPQVPLPAEVARLLGAAMPGAGTMYRFLTEDRTSTITLTPDALTLTAERYFHWEDFLDNFKLPSTALIDIYNPSFFSRIGLRYVNAIEKTRNGFPQDAPWATLIRREVLGPLTVLEFENAAINAANQLRLRLPNDAGHILFQHGLTTLPGHSEPAYMIDFDIVAEKRTEARDAEQILIEFHQLEGNAFRWCITPELHAALGPRPIEDTGA